MKNNGVLEYRSSGGMSTEKEQSPGFVPLVTIWNVNGGEILENGEYRKKSSERHGLQNRAAPSRPRFIARIADSE